MGSTLKAIAEKEDLSAPARVRELDVTTLLEQKQPQLGTGWQKSCLPYKQADMFDP